jgi:hypothetical protein
MSEALSGTKRRRAREDREHASDSPEAHAAEARKRRAFLHTMGQQLREFGNEGVSPQDQSRNTFPSPGGRSAPHAADSAVSQPSIHPNNDGVSAEDDQLPAGAAHSASKWLWRPDEVRIEVAEGRRLHLTFEDLLEWSQSYFDHWHPSFPFLHAPALLEHFQDVVRAGSLPSNVTPSSSFEHIIIRSVMSIATMDRRQMTSPHRLLPSQLVFRTFNDAVNSVVLVLTEESSILSLQALVSVQLFLISMHRYNAASRLQGIAAHLAFQLRLHRCPNRHRELPDKEAELRKRLFWSVFCMDRYISIRLGNPTVLSSDDIDVCYPQTERHVLVDGEVAGSYTNQLCMHQLTCAERDDRLDLIDFLAHHADIRGSIMKIRNKASVRDQYDDGQALSIETEHAKWWTMVDEHLSDHALTQSISKPHQVTLMVLRFETILALHRSILGNPRHDTVFNAALQRCITASRSIINTLHKALKGFGAFDGSPGQNGYESTPLLWPSFTWAIWMSTFIVVFAATEGQLSHKIAFGLADRSIEVLQHIALRGSSWPESCIVAIRNLVGRLERSRESSTTASRSGPIDPAHSRVSAASSIPVATRRPSSIPQPHRSNFADLGRFQVPRYGALNSGLPATMPDSAPYPSTTNAIGANHLGNSCENASSQDTLHGMDNYNYLNGSGNFLGIAQQSSDIPRPHEDITQLFSSEDMTWWMGPNYGFDGLV